MSEKVTHEVRPKGREDLVVGVHGEEDSRQTARAKALPREGLKRPLCQEPQGRLCGWKGERRAWWEEGAEPQEMKPDSESTESHCAGL